MNNVLLRLRPGAEPVTWPEFCATHPPYSIALDGYVSGASQYDGRGPWLNLDHHADVERFAARATCSQVLICIRQGLFDAFHDDLGRRVWAYANDCDEDVCLSWFFLNDPDVARLQSHSRLNQLVQAVDVLDTTAGASLHPLNTMLLCKLAWVFEPYRQARLNGALDTTNEAVYRSVVDAVTERIYDHLADKGHSLPLDTRYERTGGGSGWTMVKEVGAQSRIGMLACGIRAYVSVRLRTDRAWSYVIGRASPFVPFDVFKILAALNKAEDPNRGSWGGGNLIGGSPRMKGSALSPSEVACIVNQVVNNCDAMPMQSVRKLAHSPVANAR